MENFYPSAAENLASEATYPVEAAQELNEVNRYLYADESEIQDFSYFQREEEFLSLFIDLSNP